MGGTGTGGGKIVKLDNLSIEVKRVSDARGTCKERGYHRISHELKNPLDYAICYDCEVWFTREIANMIGLEYRVVPSM